jgi:hypothetical protein
MTELDRWIIGEEAPGCYVDSGGAFVMLAANAMK